MKEETAALGVSCLTIREGSEPPTTVEQNANTMVGGEADPNHCGVEAVRSRDGKGGRICSEHINFHVSRPSKARVANGPATEVA